LCHDCIDQVAFYEPPWPVLLEEPWPLRDVRAAAHLSGPLREAVHSFKYQGLRALAGVLGEILWDCWLAEPWAVDLVVPVPLHRRRQRERGYNQSALLCRELARRAHLPWREDALLRVQPTVPQVGLTAAERAANVRGVFQSQGDCLANRRVLLIDDVMTTGATVRECAEAVLAGGAVGVWGLVLAHD